MKQKITNNRGRVKIRGATGLNLSGFELIELLIFGLRPGSGFGPIKNFELRASKKPGKMARAGPGSGSGLGPLHPYYIIISEY